MMDKVVTEVVAVRVEELVQSEVMLPPRRAEAAGIRERECVNEKRQLRGSWRL
jgi:hypothetical protein